MNTSNMTETTINCVENSSVLRNSMKDHKHILDELMDISNLYKDKTNERNVEKTKDSNNISSSSIISNLTEVNSFNVGSNYDTDASDLNDNNLIKVGVIFETSPPLIFGNNLEVTILSTDANESISSIPNVTLDIDDDIPIHIPTLNKSNKSTGDKYEIINEQLNTSKHVESKIVANNINDLKGYLKSMIDELYETINFLKLELEEKNLLIRALTLRDANDGRFITDFPNESIVNEDNCYDTEDAKKVKTVDYDDTSDIIVLNSTMKNESENINKISDSSSVMGYVRFTNYENKSTMEK